MKRVLVIAALVPLLGVLFAVPHLTTRAQGGVDLCETARADGSLPGYEVMFAPDGGGEVRGGSGRQVIVGSDGDDTLRGDSSHDILCGFGGDDVLIGGSGNDILVGGEGADDLSGNSGNDTVYSDQDDRSIRGGSGNDRTVQVTPTDVLPTPTATDVPPTPTATDVPPTPTATDVPPTPTATDVPPTPTATDAASGLVFSYTIIIDQQHTGACNIQLDVSNGKPNHKYRASVALENNIITYFTAFVNTGDTGEGTSVYDGAGDLLYAMKRSGEITSAELKTLQGSGWRTIATYTPTDSNDRYCIAPPPPNPLPAGCTSSWDDVMAGTSDLTLIFSASGVTTEGTADDELIIGTGEADIINGNGGNDRICGGRGSDTISGGAGNDAIYGNQSDDTLNGDGGDDTIYGGNGSGDFCDGGSGNNTVRQCELPPTATSTATDVPPTVTATDVPPTATATDVPLTATATDVPPTATATDVPPTATATDVSHGRVTLTYIVGALEVIQGQRVCDLNFTVENAGDYSEVIIRTERFDNASGARSIDFSVNVDQDGTVSRSVEGFLAYEQFVTSVTVFTTDGDVLASVYDQQSCGEAPYFSYTVFPVDGGTCDLRFEVVQVRADTTYLVTYTLANGGGNPGRSIPMPTGSEGRGRVTIPNAMIEGASVTSAVMSDGQDLIATGVATGGDSSCGDPRATPTATDVPATATATTVPPTATATNEVPTATATAVLPTATATPDARMVTLSRITAGPCQLLVSISGFSPGSHSGTLNNGGGAFLITAQADGSGSTTVLDEDDAGITYTATVDGVTSESFFFTCLGIGG